MQIILRNTIDVYNQLYPPSSKRCEILNSLRVSNLARLPLAVYSTYSERLWLQARTFLVALENRLSWPGELN